MKGEWCYFKNRFSPEECQKILNLGLKLPVEEAKIGVNGDLVASNVRRSKIRFIQKTDPDFEWLFDELWKMAIQANDEWFKFNVTKITYIQLAEYDETYQGEYQKHHDIFWMNNDPNYVQAIEVNFHTDLHGRERMQKKQDLLCDQQLKLGKLIRQNERSKQETNSGLDQSANHRLSICRLV